jgi:hypothetical protein
MTISKIILSLLVLQSLMVPMLRSGYISIHNDRKDRITVTPDLGHSYVFHPGNRGFIVFQDSITIR